MRLLGLDRLHREGHEFLGQPYGVNPLLQVIEKLFLRLAKAHSLDGCRGSRGMPPPAEGGRDLSHIHFLDPAPGNQINSVFHLGQGKEDVDILHVFQLMDQEGKVSDVFAPKRPWPLPPRPLYHVPGGALDQFIEQGDLVRGQLPGNQARHDIQIGSLGRAKRPPSPGLPAWWKKR